ncbi:hypothetical protein [Nocardia transvalensis]|uniref:hypothetical protein n=1 Tax=Nocardia transvalensis TaxID=37333 RepID=UPI0012F68DAF|nr:hypothetical protein [Nocardia transvalensis]
MTETAFHIGSDGVRIPRRAPCDCDESSCITARFVTASDRLVHDMHGLGLQLTVLRALFDTGEVAGPDPRGVRAAIAAALVDLDLLIHRTDTAVLALTEQAPPST